MSQDEILKVVGGIVVVVLIIGLIIFLINQASDQSKTLTDSNVTNAGTGVKNTFDKFTAGTGKTTTGGGSTPTKPTTP